MDKLANYGSDDDYEESPKREKTEYQEKRSHAAETSNSTSKAHDVNYDEVGMDLSEDSDGSSKGDGYRSKTSEVKAERERDRDREKERKKERRESPKQSSRYRGRDEDRGRGEDRHERERDDGDGKERDEGGRYSRDRDDKYRGRDRDRDRDEGRERGRYRDARRGGRSRSRSSGKRRRSNSRDRGGKYGYSRRHEKANNKMAHLEKMGIEIKTPEGQVERTNEQQKPGAVNEKNFFLPGVTGRLREQMERRKLLWQKKEPEKPALVAQPMPGASAAACSSKTGKVWEATIFAQDQDGKQASKFKRLMGIRDSSNEQGKAVPDIVKKQEELFSTMEQQYEVARTATHTMRGVGLGFGSFQR